MFNFLPPLSSSPARPNPMRLRQLLRATTLARMWLRTQPGFLGISNARPADEGCRAFFAQVGLEMTLGTFTR